MCRWLASTAWRGRGDAGARQLRISRPSTRRRVAATRREDDEEQAAFPEDAQRAGCRRRGEGLRARAERCPRETGFHEYEAEVASCSFAPVWTDLRPRRWRGGLHAVTQVHARRPTSARSASAARRRTRPSRGTRGSPSSCSSASADLGERIPRRRRGRRRLVSAAPARGRHAQASTTTPRNKFDRLRLDHDLWGVRARSASPASAAGRAARGSWLAKLVVESEFRDAADETTSLLHARCYAPAAALADP